MDRIQTRLLSILNGTGFQGLPVRSRVEALALAKLAFPMYSKKFLESELNRLKKD